MSIFEKYLLKRDKLLNRRIEIDVSLYEELERFTKVYDGSINKLVNIAIIDLIANRKVDIYKRPEDERTEPHNFTIRESSYKELEKMKNEYGISIFKLVNIAIYLAIQD